MATNTYTKLDSYTVTGSSVSTITFSNIPASYTDLKIELDLRTDGTSTPVFFLGFNGYSTGFFSIYQMEGYTLNSTQSASASGGVTNALGVMPSTTQTALTFGAASVYIPNYCDTTKYKTFSIDSVAEGNISTEYVFRDQIQGTWVLKDAIRSISIIAQGGSYGNWVANSTATLYGIYNDSTVAAVPSAPTIGTATVDGGLISVPFTPNGSIPTAGYTITSTPSGGSANGTSSPIIVSIGSGLTAGTAYTFTATAYNPYGSASSAASNSVTPLAGYGTTYFQGVPVNGLNRSKVIGWNGSVFVGNYENTTAASYSADGITWTNSTMAQSAYWYPGAGVVGGNYITAAYSSNATCYTSNGTTWTNSTMPASDNWYVSATNGSNKIMFVCRLNNTLATSTNGSSWTSYSTLPSSADWQAVGWINGSEWIVTASGSTAGATTTNDGATWTSRTLPASAANWATGNSTIVLAGTGTTTYYYSTNGGGTWSTGTLPSGSYTDCSWNGKTFVAMGNDTISTSANGTTWTSRVSPANINGNRDLCFGGSGNNTWVMADGTLLNPRNRYSTY